MKAALLCHKPDSAGPFPDLIVMVEGDADEAAELLPELRELMREKGFKVLQ